MESFALCSNMRIVWLFYFCCRLALYISKCRGVISQVTWPCMWPNIQYGSHTICWRTTCNFSCFLGELLVSSVSATCKRINSTVSREMGQYIDRYEYDVTFNICLLSPLSSNMAERETKEFQNMNGWTIYLISYNNIHIIHIIHDGLYTRLCWRM